MPDRRCVQSKPKKVVKIPTTIELHAISDKLGTDEKTARFRALVLLAGWCGLRFGEVSELRRKDFDRECAVVTISRGGHAPTRAVHDRHHENGEQRIVTIPPRTFAKT